MRKAATVARLATCMLMAALARHGSASESLPSSEYQTTVWRVEDGLPQSTVTCLAQSAEGYLWLGTQNGLVRFDGIKFRVFDENNTPAIKNSRIVKILSAADGALWIGAEQGELIYWRAGEFKSYEMPGRGTTHEYARTLCIDAQGALWQASCEWQLIRFANGQAAVESDDWDLSSHVVYGAACDLAGTVWVGTGSELAKLRGAKFQSVWNQTNEANFQVDYLGSTRNGGVWVAGNGRVRRFNEGRWVADLGRYGWSNCVIYDLYEDRERRVWIATFGGGLFRYEPNGTGFHLTSQNGLPTDFVRCVLEDRQGNVWVGTEGGGLCRLSRPVFATVGVKQGLASDQVMAIAKGRDGGTWIGTDGNGLDYWKNGRARHYGLSDGLGNGVVWSVLEDAHGTVWAGTWDGLYGREGDRFRGLSDGQTIGWQVLAIYEDRQGDLWLGQQAFGGITRLRHGERTVVPIPGISATLDVRAMVEDRAGNLWIGTSENGLYRMKDGKFRHFGKADGLASKSIWSLYVDGSGTLWVGSCRGGLSRLWNGRFVTWTTRNGLLNNVICQIQEDEAGNMWFGSYGGVFRVRKEELLAPPGQTLHCVGYNLQDGLPSMECPGGFQPSSYKSPDGRLWFPTTKGLVVVDPKKVSVNVRPPRVMIEEVIADGRAIRAKAGKIIMAPGTGRIEIQYTAFDFTAPTELRFKCRLEPLEKEWEQAGAKRSVEYSRVPPGDYLFHVIAQNRDGTWNDTGATVEITTLPYFWQTKWFVAATTVAGVAVLLFCARLYEQRRLRRRLEQAERERAVERERARIARDIHDDLGANLTEIVLLSQFAQEPGATPAQALADMRKITAKARSLTRMMDEVVWAVNPKNDSLEKFVSYTCGFAEEYLRTAKIPCRLDVPELLPEIFLSAELRHNLFLTVKEALNNVVKHAAASEVWLQIALEGPTMVIAIRDNGRGFGAEQISAAAGQRHGLVNMRKRIEGIGGRIEWDNADGGGARVKLVVGLAGAAPCPSFARRGRLLFWLAGRSGNGTKQNSGQ